MGSAELMLFLGLLLGGYAAFSFVSFLFNSNNDKQALSWANNSEPVKSKNPVINACRPLVHQMTLKYALKYRNENYRKRIRYLIKVGGLSQELNEDEFIGLQMFLGVVFPIFVMVLNFALEIGLPMGLVVILAPLGVYLPIMHANASKNLRAQSVRSDLPFFIDILALSVEAGLDLFAALQKIVDKADLKTSVLANELSIVLKDVKIGSSKAQALRDMKDRLDLNEVTSFLAVLIDNLDSGASIADVLKDQSEQMRVERFARAEKAGAKASQAIMIPLMLFIMPAVFIMVFGPVAISMLYGGK